MWTEIFQDKSGKYIEEGAGCDKVYIIKQVGSFILTKPSTIGRQQIGYRIYFLGRGNYLRHCYWVEVRGEFSSKVTALKHFKLFPKKHIQCSNY